MTLTPTRWSARLASPRACQTFVAIVRTEHPEEDNGRGLDGHIARSWAEHPQSVESIAAAAYVVSLHSRKPDHRSPSDGGKAPNSGICDQVPLRDKGCQKLDEYILILDFFSAQLPESLFALSQISLLLVEPLESYTLSIQYGGKYPS